MFVILVFLLVVILSVMDSTASTAFFMIAIYLLGVGLTFSLPTSFRQQGQKIFSVAYLAYVSLAYIVSFSFSSIDHFLVSDSSRYIESYINRKSFFYDLSDFVDCYLHFSDTNLLYNAYLNTIAMFANNTLGGFSVFGLTLCQTCWGALCSILLFKILTRRFDADKAYKYTLYFVLCSHFLFYSTVIIRDILICFLFLVAFDIVDQKFSWSGVVKLLVVIAVAWGIRLYSGVFAVSFLGYYFYVNMRNSRLRHVATFIFAIILLAAASSILASSLMEQTVSEMNEYEELSAERSAGGVVSRLQSLPPGISQLAIVLFTMIKPLPPFSIYIGVESFSNFVMSTMVLVAGCFWFVVFYSLCHQLIIKKFITIIPFENVVLLLVCLVFMLANAAHPDVRRMMPVFPILYMQFVEINKREGLPAFGGKVSKYLMAVYVIIAFATFAL